MEEKEILGTILKGLKLEQSFSDYLTEVMNQEQRVRDLLMGLLLNLGRTVNNPETVTKRGRKKKQRSTDSDTDSFRPDSENSGSK